MSNWWGIRNVERSHRTVKISIISNQFFKKIRFMQLRSNAVSSWSTQDESWTIFVIVIICYFYTFTYYSRDNYISSESDCNIYIVSMGINIYCENELDIWETRSDRTMNECLMTLGAFMGQPHCCTSCRSFPHLYEYAFCCYNILK